MLATSRCQWSELLAWSEGWNGPRKCLHINTWSSYGEIWRVWVHAPLCTSLPALLCRQARREEGRSHPHPPFAAGPKTCLCLAGLFPSCSHHIQTPSLLRLIPLQQKPQDLPIQVYPLSMTGLACTPGGLFVCKGHAGTQNPLIPCKTSGNPAQAGFLQDLKDLQTE